LVGRDPRRIEVFECVGQRQPVRRDSAAADLDDQRHAPRDAVGIGCREGVADALGVLSEAGK